jgi:hypothetical protein
MFRNRLIKWLIRGIAAVALVAALGVLTLLFLMWREHKTEITLPSPTGLSDVGRTMYTWVNDSETDEFAPVQGTKRQVIAWIWYPAATSSAPPAEYLPAPWRDAEAKHSGVLMTKFLTRDSSLVHTHSTSDPNVSSEQRSYPIVIMRAGGGALTTDFTTLAEDLASHGYVVVGFDAPYLTSFVVLPDRRVVERPPSNDPENLDADQAHRLIARLLPIWTSDTKFVVNQLEQLNGAPSGKFAGRLDLHRLGMFGHSFGGATALQFCHEDVRCKAGVDIDGAPYGSVVQDGLRQPFMFILSDHSRELSDPAGQQVMADIHSIYGGLPNGFLSTIRGANHFSFSDQALLKSQYLIRMLSSFGGMGKLDSHRGLSITSDYVHTFFDIHLKDSPPSLMKEASTRYPEVQFESR